MPAVARSGNFHNHESDLLSGISNKHPEGGDRFLAVPIWAEDGFRRIGPDQKRRLCESIKSMGGF